MYEEYFGLSGSPFRLNPDPNFFFGSESHNKAIAYLHYGLKQAEGFIVITGPIGAGKSMVISQLLGHLDRSNIIAAELLTSNIKPAELLRHILSSFRIEAAGEGRAAELEAFEDYLFDQLNSGRRPLLIVDEAQNMPNETLEELRMLSNIDYEGTPLFQVFLVGQPEFRKTMSAKKMEQLRQRVIAAYHLENLSREETREYILHRLSVVGWRENPQFESGAFEGIYKETGGRPRKINTLCNRMMMYCALEKSDVVNSATVLSVIEEMHEEKLGGSKETKKIALPPVKIVNAPDTSSPMPTTGAVIVPISGGRDVRLNDPTSLKTEATKTPKPEPADAPLAAEDNESQSGQPESSSTVGGENMTGSQTVEQDTSLKPTSSSVFDRLRGDNSAKASAPKETTHTPAGATLKDVASAIAAAGSEPPRKEDEEFAPTKTSSKEFGDAAETDDTQAHDLPLSMVRSIDNTRDELRQAHASVDRLRRSLSEMKSRRDEKRKKVVQSLTRAEKILSELRDAWK